MIKSKSQKRRERRIALAKLPEIDGDAYRQGLKLDRIQVIGPVQQPRLGVGENVRRIG